MPVAHRPPAKIHPELDFNNRSIPHRIWDSLVHPIVRLPVEIPWNLKEFSKLYVTAAMYYLLGSVLPLAVIFGATMFAVHMWPENMVDILLDSSGEPNKQLMLAAMVTSFVSGFGAELWYFNAQLKKAGLGLVQILHLNLDSLNGKWTEALKRSSYALVLGLAGQDLIERLPQLPHPHQVTADLAQGLQGPSLLAFGLLAAVMAPFFEEIVFRGFIFNSFRKVFREGRIFKLVGSERMADYWAVGLSGLIFAAAHMDATAFLQLFLLGIILAELYRRSGTLVCPMLLHAMNNIVATMLIVGK
ncbi:MAG TPA: CPBP family intramembrane glutamic endopeptidase [Candidatus Obscuribacterales bacterium]